MHGSIRRIIVFSCSGVVVLLLGVWWYSGFSLDFMTFFAATPPSPDALREPGGTSPAPSGCYYQQVQCIQAPCPPILVCPNSTPPSDASRVSCSPSTQTIAVGIKAQLQASGGAGPYAWFAPQGAPATQATGAAFSVSYNTTGVKKVTVQGSRLVNDLAQSMVDSVACTVTVK